MVAESGSTFLLLSQAEIERSDSNNVINENEFGFTISLAEKHELSSAGAFTVASIILSAILSLLFYKWWCRTKDS